MIVQYTHIVYIHIHKARHELIYATYEIERVDVCRFVVSNQIYI